MSAPINKSEQTLAQNILDDIRLIEQIANEDRIAEGYILLQNVEKLVQDLSSWAKELINGHLANSETIAMLRNSGAKIVEMLDLIKSKQNWNTWNSKLGPHQDVSLFLHSTEPEGQYHFKTEGYLRNISMVDAAAALLEIDLHRYWIPMCTVCRAVSSSSVHQKVVKMKFDFVLLKKTATMHVRGDVLPDGSLLLTFSPHMQPSGDGKSMSKGSSENMDLWGGILLQDIDILEETPRNRYQDLIDFVQSRRQQVVSSGADYVQKKMAADDDSQIELTSPRKNSESASFVGAVASNALESSELEGKDNDNTDNDANSFRNPENSNMNSEDDNANIPGFPWSMAEQAELGILSQPEKKTAVIKVQAVFMADLKIDFIPDWIFNLGMRSTASMFIPMLQQHASLFASNGLHYELKQKNADLYDLIEGRIKDYTLKN
jgi:hypothetical protein